MLSSAKSASLLAVLAAATVLTPLCARAQWWSRAPSDYEECAESAAKSDTREAKAAALSECGAKFAARRKPGGGYTYFDFMQNRNFDIAGPNPTAAEQKHIDEQYIVYLDNQRHNNIVAALTAKQQELQQASLRSEAEKPPPPPEVSTKPQSPAADNRLRARTGNCPKHSFSCDWPRISEGLNDLKKLFGMSPGKGKRLTVASERR